MKFESKYAIGQTVAHIDGEDFGTILSIDFSSPNKEPFYNVEWEGNKGNICHMNPTAIEGVV